MTDYDLLIELGCEELPAHSVMPLASHLGRSLEKLLHQAQLCRSEAKVYATPRRLAVFVPDVGDVQSDQETERRGPARVAAFDDHGEPTRALQGFLKSADASLEDIKYVNTPKGEWVVVRQVRRGLSLSDILNQALPDIIKDMPMPRRMRWGRGSEEFLRPVSWFLAMHGRNVLPLSLLGLNASNKTFGHRFHAPEVCIIDEPAQYETVLEKAFVVVDPFLRRQHIVDQVQTLADQLSATPVMDHDLVDEVNALVEWPVALAGRFEEQYLEIPKEALIQTMQENQRYFALEDEAGALLPAFITVANLQSEDPQTVIDGNERVIRPRFADTMFFWNQDKQRPLSSHQDALQRLLFQEKLGSVADKANRMAVLGRWLAEQLAPGDTLLASHVETATALCKCDLNTEIVKELAKMQGICGRYYAARDGHDADVAEAMEEHYFPKQSGGALPTGRVSQLVSLADKTDTLAGIFGLGMKPTGAKDPFALRRACIGISRILIEKKLDLDLSELLDTALTAYGSLLDEPDRQGMLDYLLERLRGYLLDRGYATDAIEAVLAKHLMRPVDIVARLEAVDAFRQTPNAASLSAASKRIENILKKAEQVPEQVDPSLLTEQAEQALFAQVQLLQPLIDNAMKQRDYQFAMQQTSQLRTPVDQFFDDVMVMDENPSLRLNRLALLRRVNGLCCSTAELSLLTPSNL